MLSFGLLLAGSFDGKGFEAAPGIIELHGGLKLLAESADQYLFSRTPEKWLIQSFRK
jgi:hypothetical protein